MAPGEIRLGDESPRKLPVPPFPAARSRADSWEGRSRHGRGAVHHGPRRRRDDSSPVDAPDQNRAGSRHRGRRRTASAAGPSPVSSRSPPAAPIRQGRRRGTVGEAEALTVGWGGWQARARGSGAAVRARGQGGSPDQPTDRLSPSPERSRPGPAAPGRLGARGARSERRSPATASGSNRRPPGSPAPGRRLRPEARPRCARVDQRRRDRRPADPLPPGGPAGRVLATAPAPGRPHGNPGRAAFPRRGTGAPGRAVVRARDIGAGSEPPRQGPSPFYYVPQEWRSAGAAHRPFDQVEQQDERTRQVRLRNPPPGRFLHRFRGGKASRPGTGRPGRRSAPPRAGRRPPSRRAPRSRDRAAAPAFRSGSGGPSGRAPARRGARTPHRPWDPRPGRPGGRGNRRSEPPTSSAPGSAAGAGHRPPRARSAASRINRHRDAGGPDGGVVGAAASAWILATRNTAPGTSWSASMARFRSRPRMQEFHRRQALAIEPRRAWRARPPAAPRFSVEVGGGCRSGSARSTPRATLVGGGGRSISRSDTTARVFPAGYAGLQPDHAAPR